MPKKNGFIAISIIYSFFLCFIMLMMGMLANYTHSKLILRKTNEPLIFEQDSHLTAKIMRKYPSRNTVSDFSQGCPTSSDNSCSGLFQTVDDDGDSYYFRGAVDNYVQFAGQNWRIVRINGDGTIRLILDGDIGKSAFNTNYNERKYVGYTYDNDSACTNSSPCTSEYSSGNFKNSKGGNNSTIKDQLEKWYKTNISSFDSKIALTTYCNDTSFGSGSETGTLYYGAYKRLWIASNPVSQLTCPNPTQSDNSLRDYGGVYKLKIGLLSADEIVLAGFKPTDSTGVTTSNYLYYADSSSSFWSSSPYYTDTRYNTIYVGILNSRYLNSGDVNGVLGVRPVINLRADVIATGDGTKDNPYVIK